MERLFHIAVRDDWNQAQAEGAYRISTLGKPLEEGGFVHLSFRHQVKLVADAVYRGRQDLVLLELDADQVADQVRLETVPGSDEQFPHLYDAIFLNDVLAARPFRSRADGEFDPPA